MATPPRPEPLLFVAINRVADEPEHGRPQSNKESAAFGVAALLLIDRLRADPQSYAKAHRGKRCGVEVPAPQSGCLESSGEHDPSFPACVIATHRWLVSWLPQGVVQCIDAEASSVLSSPCHRRYLALRSRVDVVDIHVADNADAPPGRAR